MGIGGMEGMGIGGMERMGTAREWRWVECGWVGWGWVGCRHAQRRITQMRPPVMAAKITADFCSSGGVKSCVKSWTFPIFH